MKLTRMDAVAIVLTTAQAAAAVYVFGWGRLGPLPMHFGLHGEVNRWGDRTEAAIVIAVSALATGLLYALLPALSRRRGDSDAASRGLRVARLLLLAILSMVGLLMTAIGVGLFSAGGGSSAWLQTVFLSAILLALGAWVGKAGPNPLVGVRTYWSLRSRLAWDKSNRLFGRIAFWTGLAGLAAGPFAPPPIALSLLLTATMAAGALAIFESWRVWRSDPDRTAA